jgi:hypothetical protein
VASGEDGEGTVTVAWPSKNHRDEPDPFLSPGQQAERDAFDNRGWLIRVGIVLALVLALVVTVLLFR